MNGETHYILAITERNGRFQLAACNTWVREDEHSTEPTCEKCRQYVLDDSRELSAEDVFGIDRDDPLMQPVKSRHFDPLADYSERRR